MIKKKDNANQKNFKFDVRKGMSNLRLVNYKTSSKSKSIENNIKQELKSHLIQPGLKQKSNKRIKLKVCLTLKYA